MKTQIEKNIPIACAVLQAYLTTEKKTLFPKEFKGYIAAFGPSVRMSGLLSTLAFYSDQKNAKENRAKVLQWLCSILSDCGGHKVLFEEVCKRQGEVAFIRKTEHDLSHAVTALKLAFRTFPVEGDTPEND